MTKEFYITCLFKTPVMVIQVAICLSPVFLLLLLLLFLDSLRLVNKTILLICLGWGIVSAALSFYANTFLITEYHLSFEIFSGYIAPFVEEILKLLLILLLIRKNKIGFMIDGAIYGFSIGAAFSLAENIFYLIHYSSGESNIMVWITRGFGTALMHGGTTAVFAILVISSLNRQAFYGFAVFAGALTAVVIHASFNALTAWPVFATVFILVVIPLALVLSFQFNENAIRKWLEMEFDTEVSMLTMIRKGKFSETRTGQYLMSIRSHFPPEMVFDLYCFISLYTELSIKAKSMMMLRENDFVVSPDPEIQSKLRELKSLQKTIGHSGYLAIAPVLRMNRKDLWKLSMLASGK
ncbi:MAG: PrsW family intramembrane metalloprotease [Bacteroidetes bacterium]|nr:MAG: PrsW family intramembrane metalloprotease [Bacteroidota bacterium]